MLMYGTPIFRVHCKLFLSPNSTRGVFTESRPTLSPVHDIKTASNTTA